MFDAKIKGIENYFENLINCQADFLIEQIKSNSEKKLS